MVDYEGILGGYPYIRDKTGRLASVLQLIRPYTLTAPLIAGILGTLAPTTWTYDHIVTAIFCGVTLALSQACGQVINQYADVELDKIVKPYRPLPKGDLTRDEALGIAWLLAIISIARGFTINQFFGLTNLSLIFFAVFYSVAPLSPRCVHCLVNVWWMAFSRGFLPVLAVYSVYGSVWDAVTYGALAFLWVMAMQGTKDIPDMRGDRAFAIKTIPNQWGINGLKKWIYVVMIVYLFASLLMGLLIYGIVLGLFAIIASRTLETKAKITENTIAWALFYAGIGMHYILMYAPTTLNLSLLL